MLPVPPLAAAALDVELPLELPLELLFSPTPLLPFTPIVYPISIFELERLGMYRSLYKISSSDSNSFIRPGTPERARSGVVLAGDCVGDCGGGGGIPNCVVPWVPEGTCPEGGGGALEGALVRAADMGEHTMPPMPMLFKAERGDADALPNAPDVRRTCGGMPLLPPPREGDMEGEAPRRLLGEDEVLPEGEDRPRRRGERSRAS